MTCVEARETLWPVRQPRLVAGQYERARHHLDSCPACQRHMQESEVLADAYNRMPAVKAPLELRERVFTAIARERASSEGRESDAGAVVPPRRDPVVKIENKPSYVWTPGRWAAAAATVVALGTGLMLTQPSETPARVAGAMFVDDYLRRAVGQERIATSDPATVRQWLTRELGMSMDPLELAGLELEGAEICLLEGRRGAMILYRRDGVQVAHYLVPREGAEARAPVVGRGLAEADGAMPPLVTWSTPSVEQALVGDLESQELLALARSAF